MKLGDSIISVTTSYAKLRKLSKKCCRVVCQAEQTSNIYLVTMAAVCQAEVWKTKFCGDGTFQ